MYDEFGVECLYTPKGGAEVKVRVIARQPDEVVGFGETRINTPTTLFEVRASEVAMPRSGDLLNISGVEYIVQGEPQRRDTRRLVWTLDVRPA
ncbi:MAG: hypothetical protein GY832_30070 [Chloroflexi bacterium]|nr:hypothetical protein [Chloroflexota bacterium]